MTVGARLRSALPDRAKERARLNLADRLVTRTRDSSARRGAALVLHAVGPEAGDPERELDPALSTARLDQLVAHLGGRYVFVRADDLITRIEGRNPGEPVPVALTFDDDLASHLGHAAPVLDRHGVVATAFLGGESVPFWWQVLQRAVDRGALVAASLPQGIRPLAAAALAREPWALARLAKKVEELEPERDELRDSLLPVIDGLPPALDLEGARALARRGWEIGFHTRRHDRLPGLDDERLASALRDGRDRLPGSPRTFAYPHGKADSRVAAAVRAAGYDAAFTGAATVVTERTDPHLIGRLQIESASAGQFALRLARALADSEGA